MEKQYKKIWIGTILIKLILAWYIPLTSDEAYYLTWSKHLELSYYDHPPVVGWFLYMFAMLGDHIFFFRLFPILVGIAVAAILYVFLKRTCGDAAKARLLLILFLVSPLHVFFIVISSDVPLFLFVFLSGIAFFQAVQTQKLRYFVLTGITLGLAILSKYFAGLLIPAYVCYLLVRSCKTAILKSLLIFSGMLPFLLVHLYGEYNNCWTVVMFNIFNRNSGGSLDLKNFFSFLGIQLYLATPWVLYYMIKYRSRVHSGLFQEKSVFIYLFGIPVTILGMLSFLETGLHWFISFYPFLFFILTYLDDGAVSRSIFYSAGFSALHVVIILTCLLLPVETFKNFTYYRDVIFYGYGDEVCSAIEDTYKNQYELATNAYNLSGGLSYHCRQDVMVFLSYSKFGRYDDKQTDFKKLDGKDILILSTLPVKRDYSRFFEHIKLKTLSIRKNTFYLVLGNNFHYSVYKNDYLESILNSKYSIPKFLPVGDCYFYSKYFPERYNCR